MNQKSRKVLNKVLEQIDELEECLVPEEALKKAKLIYDAIDGMANQLSIDIRELSMKFKFDGEKMEELNDLRDLSSDINRFSSGIRKGYGQKRLMKPLNDARNKILSIVLK